MSFEQKAKLGLLIFALVAVLIVGSLAWVMHSASVRRNDQAERAAQLCGMELSNFALKPAQVRNSLLDEALKLTETIEADKNAIPEAKENAQKLPGWRDRMTALNVELQGFEHRMAKIRTILGRTFPSDDMEQLSAEEEKEREAAATQAMQLGDSVAGEAVRLSETALGADTKKIQDKAKTVLATIKRRNLDYRNSIMSVNDILGRGRQLTEEEINKKVNEIDGWIKIAAANLKKEEQLKSYKKRFEDILADLKKLSELERRFRKLIDKGLRSRKPKVVTEALQQYDALRTDAQRFESELVEFVEEAKLARAEAQAWVEGYDKWKQAQTKGRDIVDLIQKFLGTAEEDERTRVKRSIQQNIRDLNKLDKDYAEALGTIFKKLQETLAKEKTG